MSARAPDRGAIADIVPDSFIGNGARVLEVTSPLCTSNDGAQVVARLGVGARDPRLVDGRGVDAGATGNGIGGVGPVRPLGCQSPFDREVAEDGAITATAVIAGGDGLDDDARHELGTV